MNQLSNQINTFENFVYIIRGISYTSNRTKYYIGYTNDLYQRIRKHNREITGGAKATKGYKWSYCCVFTNIRSRVEGLQLEKRLQICKRKGNIIDKINTFLSYIDKNNCVSPNGQILESKIFFYVDKTLLPGQKGQKGQKESKEQLINVTKNAIIFNIKFTEILLEHLMSSTNIKPINKIINHYSTNAKSII